MPVLDVCRDLDDVAGMQALCRLALFLIPALALNADQHLAAALARVVDVPVVATARLKRDVADGQVIIGIGERLKIALTDKVLGKGGIGHAKAKEPAVTVGACGIVGIDLLGHVEGRPGVGPAGIEGDVCQKLSHFLARHAVGAGACKVVLKRAVRNALADQRTHAHDAAQLERHLCLAAPYLAKENVVVEVCELGSELAERIVACSLFYGHDLLLCFAFFLQYVDEVIEDFELALLGVNAVEQVAAIGLKAADAGTRTWQLRELADKCIAAASVT